MQVILTLFKEGPRVQKLVILEIQILNKGIQVLLLSKKLKVQDILKERNRARSYDLVLGIASSSP